MNQMNFNFSSTSAKIPVIWKDSRSTTPKVKHYHENESWELGNKEMPVVDASLSTFHSVFEDILA